MLRPGMLVAIGMAASGCMDSLDYSALTSELNIDAFVMPTLRLPKRKKAHRVPVAPARITPRESDAQRLAALEDRFKRGEIDEWTYLDKRQEIEGR